jgi:hypothetical protein
MSKLQKIYYPATAFAYIILPLIAIAAPNVDALRGPIRDIGGVLNTVIGVLFVLATVIFLWGVIQFIASSGSEEGRKKAKGIMTWGIIGLAVMAAAWGVANILITFFGATTPPQTPTLPNVQLQR